MDDHPVVLEQGIQSLTVGELGDQSEVIGIEGPGQAEILRGFAQEEKGVEAKLEIPEIEAEEHGA